MGRIEIYRLFWGLTKGQQWAHVPRLSNREAAKAGRSDSCGAQLLAYVDDANAAKGEHLGIGPDFEESSCQMLPPQERSHSAIAS
jgi:hypothetical protein